LTQQRILSTFVLMEVETLGVARLLEGAYALRQRLSAGNEVHAPVRLPESASEAKRYAHRRGEHVAPSSSCLVLKRFRLQAFAF
jgi:hypothetical protein